MIGFDEQAGGGVGYSTRPGLMPRAGHRGRVIAVAAAALIAGGCSATGSAPSAPASSHPAARSSTPSAGRSSPPHHRRHGFTVSGSFPVTPNSSQDTHAQAAGAPCRRPEFRHARSLGMTTAAGFTITNAPVAGDLLGHFLDGKGTAVRYGPRSPIAREARASNAFRELNRRVQAAVLSQLTADGRHVRLPGSDLTPVYFDLAGSAHDLYLGFRGTQGLTVRGAGTRKAGRYAGRLTYVIRDSYGFPPQDQLLGIGTEMRYLQVNCGSPDIHGGARWFPDSITVSVPFRHRAG